MCSRPRPTAIAGWSIRMTAPAPSWRDAAAAPSRSALLRRGVPVLGVVFAPTSPDRGPDLIAWAEGSVPSPATAQPWHHRPVGKRAAGQAHDVVLLNHGAGQRPVWNGSACARRPASCRCRRSPTGWPGSRSGTVIATVTLRPVNAHDIAAGHALLTAAGGVLLDRGRHRR